MLQSIHNYVIMIVHTKILISWSILCKQYLSVHPGKGIPPLLLFLRILSQLKGVFWGSFSMGLFSYLYLRACSFNLRAWLIYFSSDFVMLFYQALPWHSNRPCLQLDLLCFCSNCACSQIYCCLHRFPALQLQPFSLHSGCFCTFAKCLLPDFSSVLGVTCLHIPLVFSYYSKNYGHWYM